VTVYIRLGQPQRGLRMLHDSERDLPGDYHQPAGLARLYQAMKQWDDALAASDRALALMNGPPRIALLQTRAEILAGKGDLAAARATMEEAIRFAESLPPERGAGRLVPVLKKTLAGLSEGKTLP
jgi:tetratricopeptide (TPR) repeat protein